MKSIMVWLTCACFAALMSTSVHAQTFGGKQRSAQVEIRAWLGDEQAPSTTPQFTVNEQIVMTIDVSTPRWFTAGTRIQNVELANVIAMQRNPRSTNYTERRNGETWSHQRWEITLYPQASGDYVVPPLALGITVSAEDGKPLSGTLQTPPLPFQVILPSGLIDTQKSWFSASEVEVSQQWQRSNETLHVGDSIKRTVSITANDSLSVLLPALLDGSRSDVYQAYSQPSALDDTQQRGNYRSERKEEVVYVLQRGGTLTLPDIEFQWWNSETKQLEHMTIEGQSFVIKHTLSSWLRAYAPWLIALLVVLLCITVFAQLTLRYYRTHPTPTWLVFRRTLKAKEWGAARALIYREYRARTGRRTLLSTQSYSDAKPLSNAKQDDEWQTHSRALQAGSEAVNVYQALWRLMRQSSGRFSARCHRVALPKALPDLTKNKRDS